MINRQEVSHAPRLLLAVALFAAGCGPQMVSSRFVKYQHVEAGEEAVISVEPSESQELAGTRLTIPTGAVPQAVDITLEVGLEDPSFETEKLGPVAHWGPDGLKFDRRVRMTMPLTQDVSADDVLILVEEADGQRFELTDLVVDRSARTVSFDVEGFTAFQPRRARPADGGAPADAGSPRPDGGSAPQGDAGSPPQADAGSPRPDGGSPPQGDAGSPPQADAGAPRPDGGTPPQGDGGTPRPDGGSPDGGPRPDGGSRPDGGP